MTFSILQTRFDYRRIAGVSSVLGIARDGDEVSVVELKRRGNAWDTQSGHIEVMKSFHGSLPKGGLSGSSLKEALKENEIKTRHAVMSLRNVRFAFSRLPPDVENSEEWVEENMANLLKLPVVPLGLVFRVQELENGRLSRTMMISFVRQAEIEEAQQIAENAGLELLGLSSGVPDLVNIALLSPPVEPSHQFRIVHVGGSARSTLTFEENHLTALQSEYASSPGTSQEAEVQAEGGTVQTFVSGKEGNIEGGIPLRPFGLSSGFALAAALALRGVLPNGSSSEFLSSSGQAKRDTTLARNLFRRNALALGVVLILLLGAPIGVSSLIQMKGDELEAFVAASGGDLAKIASLEHEASYLRQSTGRSGSSSLRSNTALILHQIAEVTPTGIQLSSLSLDAAGSSFLINGIGASQSNVSEFMKNLKTLPLRRDVSLRRLEVHKKVSFEISASLRPAIDS